ncbi:zf-HC2 domain-containing protein [Dehalococcoidia bacterium]|nr:zf-HC2 domain-containing protein [Dehalococcoidia bacterium]
MRCDRVRERFPEYAEGALRGNDLKSFEEHLQDCKDCRHELESLRELEVRLRQEVPGYWESVKPSPAFLARLRGLELESPPGRIPSIAEAFSALWLRHRPALAVGLSVCLVVALAVTVFWIVPPGVEPIIAPAEVPPELQVQEKRDVPPEVGIPAPEPPPVAREAVAVDVEVAALLDVREQQIARAVRFLRAHFDPEVGLIHRSEGAGPMIVQHRQYRYNQTFWLYPDNLVASYALEPFEPEIAQKIRETLHHYDQPPSLLFEVLFGKPIPEDIAKARQVMIDRDHEFLIMAEFHDSPDPLSWKDYGDMLIYQSLNQHLRGDTKRASRYFDQAYSMWDGKGILDAEAKEKNRYAGHNLALILYAGRVLNITINSQIEATLWGMQNPDGGIAAYVSFEEDVLGPSCVKATAMALLAYNEELIARMP